MKMIPQVTSHSCWSSANALYREFQSDLENYKQHQYEEWCCKVSDILAQNLTREEENGWAFIKMTYSFFFLFL